MMLIMVAVVLQMTKSGLERKSHDMMRQIAMNPIQPEIPEKDYSGVRLPYFVLEIDHTAVVFSFVSASDDTLEMGSTNVLKEVSYDYS